MIAVDEILYELLRDKIDEIRANPQILDLIFEGRTVEKIEKFRQFLLSKDIRIVMHHPRDAADFPCYSIVLEGSTEAEQVIGSATYDDVYVASMEDGWVGSDSDILKEWQVDVDSLSEWEAETDYNLGDRILPSTENGCFYVCVTSGTSGAAEPSWTTISGRGTTDGTCAWECRYVSYGYPIDAGESDVIQYYSALETINGRRTCHVFGKKGSSSGKGIQIDLQNSVLEGGSISLAGFTYITFLIKSNRSGTFLEFGFGEDAHREQTANFAITEKNVWEKIRIPISAIPDRNKDEVRYMSFRIIDDSDATNIYIHTLKGEKTYGSLVNETLLDNRYRIESWSDNADLTLGLYTILLWNLLRYRDYLEDSWGLLEQRIEGGDIMPQPDYYPEFMYVRSIMLSCKTIEAVPRETDLTALYVKTGKHDWGQ